MYPFSPKGFLGGLDGKESAYSTGEPGSVPGLGRSPGEGNGYTLQYSCLENSMEREAWWGTIHEVTELDTTEQLTRSLLLSLTSINQRPVASSPYHKF